MPTLFILCSFLYLEGAAVATSSTVNSIPGVADKASYLKRNMPINPWQDKLGHNLYQVYRRNGARTVS